MITLNNKQLCENCFSETTIEPCPHCGFIKSAYRHDPITLAIGSVLNQRYMIGGVIGKGGFGITYLAYDLKLDARLAVKEYYPMGLAIRNPGSTVVTVSNEESEDSFKTGAEKFYNEAKMVAKFNGNPNIVSVHDFFYENDTVYFTMGYLQGQTLKSYLKKKKISEGQAISIFQAISSALMASHSLNILHRDISPDNIMLCDDGTIRLLDFGAARQVMAEQSQSLSVILKQGFAPLEQYQKKGKQGPWTDIYALGATIYTALTGDMLNDPMTRLEDDADFSSNKHGISESLWNVIKKCTELKIQDRYQDIFELKKDLNSIGIESEAFTDIEEEIKDILRKASRPFGSATVTGSSIPNYSPSSDPNATMLLGTGNVQSRTMSMDKNATMYLGAQGGGSSNETVAMSPEEAAAYTARQAAENSPGQTGPQNNGNMPQQPVTGGYTGQPMTGGYTGQPVTGGYGGPGPQQPGQGVPGQQQQPAKKGFPIVVIILIAVLVFGIIIFSVLRFVGAKKHGGLKGGEKPTEEASTDATEGQDIDPTEEQSSEIGEISDDAGKEADALRSAGIEDINKYINDTYKYSICYPAGYKVTDADDKTVEISNGEGSLHMAVRFMDRYIDDSILYDANDFSNMVNVRSDNLLPVEGSGDTPEVDDAGKTDIADEEDISHFEYHYKDNKDKKWEGNVYIFDSKGQYGCYVVYTLVNGKADDRDELQEYAKACADSFRIDGKYNPPEVKIYEQKKYGIKFSVTDGTDLEKNNADTLEVHFDNDGSDHRAWVVPGDNYGSELSDIFVSMADNTGETDVSITSDMTPLDFGEYKGYWVSATIDGQPGKMYGFSTNYGSDATYQTYVIVGYDSDEDQVKELVGGFRFEGATTYDNSSVDTSDTVEISSSSGSVESEYIFPGTDSRVLTNSDVDEFLSGYLDSNNANNLSESEKRKVCARGLCYARNEIYARHGYIFNSSELRNLFEGKSWYNGEIPSNRFSNDLLNSAEKKNVEFLKAKMEDYGGYKPAQ